VLIAAKFPGATQVAGFHAWKKLGRSVTKGERAIWILAPMTFPNRDGSDDERQVRGFRSVPVFDISQTEGQDLPAVCHKLTGEEPVACFDRLRDVATSLWYTVELTDLRQGVNGDCTFDLRRIRVEVRNGSGQRAKTLAHDPLTAPKADALWGNTSKADANSVCQPDNSWTQPRARSRGAGVFCTGLRSA
jgi:hypothetical protein